MAYLHTAAGVRLQVLIRQCVDSILSLSNTAYKKNTTICFKNVNPSPTFLFFNNSVTNQPISDYFWYTTS